MVAGENDLASQFPAIAAQWHPGKNETLTPQQVTPSSNRKVWWRCEKGHDYQAAKERLVHLLSQPCGAGKDKAT